MNKHARRVTVAYASSISSHAVAEIYILVAGKDASTVLGADLLIKRNPQKCSSISVFVSYFVLGTKSLKKTRRSVWNITPIHAHANPTVKIADQV